MTTTGIVQNGRDRWRSAAGAAVRAELTAEYADRLRKATIWQRLRLGREIERDVKRRLREVEPSPEALF